jgi:hypothetical protein
MATPQQQQTIQVDAFSAELYGAKILCQGPFQNNKLPPVLESVQNIREPFKKKVLLTKTAFGLSKQFSLQYDAVFQMSDISDWTLALTYIVNSPKPILVIAEDVQVPDGVWSRIGKGITFIHISSAPVKSCMWYDAVFFAPIQDIQSMYAEFVFRQLQTIFRSTYSQKEYKEILQELRIAGAGLAWTKFREQTQSQSGSMYWYDTVASQGSDTLSKKQLSDIFRWLATQFYED